MRGECANLARTWCVPCIKWSSTLVGVHRKLGQSYQNMRGAISGAYPSGVHKWSAVWDRVRRELRHRGRSVRLIRSTVSPGIVRYGRVALLINQLCSGGLRNNRPILRARQAPLVRVRPRPRDVGGPRVSRPRGEVSKSIIR